jgi:hypothetical protein
MAQELHLRSLLAQIRQAAYKAAPLASKASTLHVSLGPGFSKLVEPRHIKREADLAAIQAKYVKEFADGLEAEARNASRGTLSQRTGRNGPSSLPGLAAECKNQARQLARSMDKIKAKLDECCAKINDRMFSDPLRHSAAAGAGMEGLPEWIEHVNVFMEWLETHLHHWMGGKKGHH